MNVNVNTSKCVKCGICAEVCPVHAITKGGLPSDRGEADISCVKCGHCVAVCPQGAISVAGITPGDCSPVRKDLSASTEQIENVIRARRSIRVYRKTEVRKEDLEALIEIARHAPTASNSQQLQWIVFTSREKIRNLARLTAKFFHDQTDPAGGRGRWAGLYDDFERGIDRVMRSAPGLIIAHAPESYRFAATDGAITLTCIDIAAPSFGLGACWAGIFMAALSQSAELRKEVGIPDGRVCAGALMIGESAYDYRRLPPRNAAVVEWK
jgi:nitroreductase/NAD-dependent dihydropyrimidine dehydrogenase PreA subunit